MFHRHLAGRRADILKNWKGFFFVYTAISILLFCSKTAEASSVSYNSILTEEADWIEIADFKELRSIMNGSIRPQTRHIRLTADITVSGGKDDIYYIISPEYAPIYIDTGEYTIYVEGQLQILGNALIFGKGGEEGLVHIRKGGLCGYPGSKSQGGRRLCCLAGGWRLFQCIGLE